MQWKRFCKFSWWRAQSNRKQYGIPFEVAIPNASKSREELTSEEFDKMMKVAVKQVEKGQTTPVEEVFEELYQGVK